MKLRQTFKSFALKTFPQKTPQSPEAIPLRRVLKALTDASELDFKVVKTLVAPGDSVVDIGANIGVYTKYLSDLLGNQGRVYSIEPVPSRSISSNECPPPRLGQCRATSSSHIQ